jgi:hemoglobin
VATPYEALGGEDGVRRLAEAFYDVMDQMPQAAAVRAMHGADLSSVKQKLFEFLSGWLGGPKLYLERHGHACLMGMHARFAIGSAERDQWMLCMRQALRRVDAPAEVAMMLESPLSRVTDAMRNVEDAPAVGG